MAWEVVEDEVLEATILESEPVPRRPAGLGSAPVAVDARVPASLDTPEMTITLGPTLLAGEAAPTESGAQPTMTLAGTAGRSTRVRARSNSPR